MKIDELKEKYKESYFYQIEIENKDNKEDIVIGIKKPKVMDLEIFIKELRDKFSLNAYFNLLSRITIYPEDIDEKRNLIEKLRQDYPLVAQSFIEENIRPFFGRIKNIQTL